MRWFLHKNGEIIFFDMLLIVLDVFFVFTWTGIYFKLLAWTVFLNKNKGGGTLLKYTHVRVDHNLQNKHHNVTSK